MEMGGSNKMDSAYPEFLGFEGTSAKLAALVSGQMGYEATNFGFFFHGNAHFLAEVRECRMWCTYGQQGNLSNLLAQ